jgi:hypothetical protein
MKSVFYHAIRFAGRRMDTAFPSIAVSLGHLVLMLDVLDAFLAA